MCRFFSFCGDGHGNYLYADWAERVKLKHQDTDSHTAIFTRAGVPVEKQELWSLYEYNPLTKVFNTDRGVEGHDHEAARNWVEARDWKTIVEPLIVKPIMHPFKRRPPKVTKRHITWLKAWASLMVSVRSAVGASVGASVRASVWDSMGDSVRASAHASVWDSVGASVGASVWNSVWASVGSSVWAYVSSFFILPYKHDFSPAVHLWEAGLVPSFDGKIWRLHGGKSAKILYEMHGGGNPCVISSRSVGTVTATFCTPTGPSACD